MSVDETASFDTEAADALFERNMAVLEELDPAVADALRAMESPVSRLIGSREEGTLNIDLGHTRFYAGGAQAYCAEQTDSFIAKPRRIELPWYTEEEEGSLANHRVARRGLAHLAERGVERKPKVDPGGGYLILLGVGLGLHVEPLLEALPVRNLVLIEQHHEFILHALRTVDWARWRDILAERGGEVRLIVAEDQFLAANDLYVYVRRHHFGLIDGSYLLMHYQSSFMRGVMDEVVSRVPVIAANPGFFEDEIVMLRNGFRNLRGVSHRLLEDRRRLRLSSAAIIVASGPSTDSAIDFVRAHADKAIVATCGTGLSALLGYGIKPDFHIDTENTPGPLEIVSGLAETHDLSGITLVSCNTVDPGLPKLFDERILYFRDSVSATQFFGVGREPLMLAAPTVANAAVRAMLSLGVRTLYLVGVDLGSRDQGRHHSVKSVYFADERFLETHPEHAAASKYTIARRGSLGGTVFANTSFLYAAMYLSNLLKAYPSVKVYNLSDGARIHGAVPRLPRTVTIDATPDGKQRDLSIVEGTLESEPEYPGLTADDLKRLRAAMADAIDDLAAAFREERDLYALFDRVKALLDGMSGDPTRQTVHSYLNGTALMFFQFLYVTARRIPEAARADFMDAGCAICAEEMEALLGQFDALVEDLMSDFGKG